MRSQEHQALDTIPRTRVYPASNDLWTNEVDFTANRYIGESGVGFLVRVLYQKGKIMAGTITATPFDIHGLSPLVGRKTNLAPRRFTTKFRIETGPPIHTL